MIEEPNGVFRLNLGRLVVGYTRGFALTDPREALEYFYRLRSGIGMKERRRKRRKGEKMTTAFSFHIFIFFQL